MKITKYILPAVAALLAVCLLSCGGGGTDTPTGTATPPVEGTPAEATAEAPTEAPVTNVPTEETTEAPTEPPVTQPEEMTMEPKTTVSVISDARTEHTVVLGPGVADGNRADLDWLYRVMDEKYGTHPAEADNAAGKIISLLLDGEPRDWSVTVDEGGSVALVGGCAASLKQAIHYFATQVCGTSDGDLLADVALTHTYTYATDKIDNSGLLTYEGGSKTVLAPSDAEGKLMSPAWLDTAVMVEVRLDIASIGGKFKDSYDLIDFYAEAGVNVLWLCPIYQRNKGNGYGNNGLHTVEPALTGTRDTVAGWQVVREFVDYAHSKGVYVLLDIITWGTMKKAPLCTEHPEWYDGEAWGNAAFNWRNNEFREWFINQAVTNLEVTGADGYRCDCEPFTAGYDIFAEIRKRSNEKGLYPVIMSEDGSERRNVFDCEQDGVLSYANMSRGGLYQSPVNFFADNILRMITTCKKGVGLGSQTLQRDRNAVGTARYYTNCLTNHDYVSRNVNGNRIKIGYSAIYAPFIPLWFMGDEFGVESRDQTLYFVDVDYGQIETNPAQGIFFEDVKQMLRIRRTYGDIFGYWPLNHRETNICQVTVDGFNGAKTNNYARFMGDRMVIVVANNQENKTGVGRVEIPFEEGFTKQYHNYRVTDLLTGHVIAVGRADTVNNFSCVVPYQYMGVYLVEGIDPVPAAE